MNTTARNLLIVVAIAAAVYFLPGGGDAATFVGGLLSAGILTLFALLGVRFYRENRIAVFSLGDQHRAILYSSLGVAVFAMAALRRLFDAGGAGVLVWFALMGSAAFGLYTVYVRHREYG